MSDNEKMVPIGIVAQKLGVTEQTIRNWVNKGVIQPAETTIGGHRRFAEVEVKRIAEQLSTKKIIK